MRDHLVAGVEQRDRRVVERLLAAVGEHDLRDRRVDPVAPLVVRADRLAELGDAHRVRVAREVRIDRRLRRVFDVLRGREVRFPRAKVDDLMGQSFKVKNPNAVASCGCGVSFTV